MESQERTRFQDWSKVWLDMKKATVKETSLSIYTVHIRTHIIPFFDGVFVEDVDANIVIEFIEELEDKTGLKSKTIHDIYWLLKPMVTAKVREKSLIFDEVRQYLPPKDQEEPDILSDDEYEKLTAYLFLKISRKNAGVLIALMCGLRIGEVCGLKWEDVDLKNRFITVKRTTHRVYEASLDSQEGKSTVTTGTPKTRRSQRKVPIPRSLVFYLTQLKGLEKPDETSYITTGKSKCNEPRTFSEAYYCVLRSCEIEKHTFHSLRHTFATRAVLNGMNAETLSRILGHSDVKVTLSRYYHPSTKDLLNAIDAIFS